MCIKYIRWISPRMLLGFLGVVCVSVLIASYVLEHFFQIYPCQMCLYEQDVFIAAGAFSFLSFLFVPAHFQHYAVLVVSGIFLFGVALAGYHVAIQYHLVELPAFCASNDLSAFDSIEALREQILKTPFVRCDQVTWSLFGLSLAAYNALMSLSLSICCWIWYRCR
ncbi:MAG: hypothetical protein ACD_16C00205G0042 [uncultured bacterium]|nr:MAG: hypothetical protein ACD_16C00205G0042 [uncultured bacterium]OFX00138.1 MAG: hypothetical protein A2W62_03645 [Alphaproteobacteria bacterium RIFCSPLOWO2_02_42_7]HBG34839.1 hypothetical protein [Holosporales bacterium]HBW24904.1 hypothetical protein [Holosporales bacterium]HCC24027.1 hypothetical protein [Holosporales bacterium]